MPKPTDITKQKYMFTDDIKFLQKAVVFHPNQDKIFLALKRPSDAFTRPNDWDLAGGNVLFGELHEDSLREEIREETNLEVGDFAPVQIITSYNKEKKIYFIFNGFYCQAKNDTVKISNDTVKISDEHVDFRWVNKNEFINLKPAQYLIDLVIATFKKL
ncbi:NUDIX domain-containing protein [Candidatus Kuenenbacteria bacterium]|nr:NUDIX domain-containing protein [Candidatus Kuenenbacteria bacterium]